MTLRIDRQVCIYRIMPRNARLSQGPPSPRAAFGDGPRERLLRAANELFYTRGIRNVGIDEVIVAAGVAKASLYTHFRSKDELVAEYVRRRDASWRSWFRESVSARASTPLERLLAVFDVLAEWLASPGFRGCAFQNASIELADSAHPARAAAAANKRAVRSYLDELAREAGFADPRALADQLALVAEGAIVTALMLGRAETTPVARSARAAASALLRAGQGPGDVALRPPVRPIKSR
jgi:AcrR family transcriptional regulator